MADLIGREIFAVGKWNGKNFTESDLDEIVANFDSLNEIHKVPLKFGHNEDQPITDGQPAIGWVNRVYREGKKLFADFVDMPKTVYEAVKNKLYRTVSIELLFDVDHKGSRFNHVLDAVALLGADHPAVNTLADLDALLASRTTFSGGRRLCFETVQGKSKTQDRNFDMDKEDVKALVADAVALAVDPLKAELEDVKKERDAFKADAENAAKDKAAFEAERKKQKIVAARKKVTELLDMAVRDKSMTPAMREVYSEQIGVDSDDRVLDINVEKVKLMCSAKAMPQGGSGKVSDTAEFSDDPAVELTNKTHSFMAEHNEQNFARALNAVARANPDLHKQYLDQNGEE